MEKRLTEVIEERDGFKRRFGEESEAGVDSRLSVDHWRNQSVALSAEKIDAISEANALREELEKVKATLAVVEGARDKWIESCLRHDKNHMAAVARNNELTDWLDVATARIQELENQLLSQTTKQSLLDEIDLLKESIERLTGARDRASNDRDDWHQKYQDQKNAINRFCSEVIKIDGGTPYEFEETESV